MFYFRRVPNVKSGNGHKLNAGNSLTTARCVEEIKEHEDLSQFVKIEILTARCSRAHEHLRSFPSHPNH